MGFVYINPKRVFFYCILLYVVNEFKYVLQYTNKKLFKKTNKKRVFLVICYFPKCIMLFKGMGSTLGLKLCRCSSL